MESRSEPHNINNFHTRSFMEIFIFFRCTSHFATHCQPRSLSV
jgi:hypothetical protein